ncbi:MAG: ParA family protein [Chloroflexi bacterium]|nr:ParA family protein [Chloroflexota bacterium]
MIISLISQKGGVGKSALSRLIAVEFAKGGWSVKIGDLDKLQGSTTKWKTRRDQNSIEPEIAVEKYATVERAIRDSANFDLMVLDGPAFAESGGKTMAKASDLVIMPSGYALDDLDPQIETAYDLEQAGIDPEKILFIFCRAEGSKSEDKAARDYLRRARMSVLKPVFPERASIRQAHNEGRAASEVPFPSIQERILPLSQAIADKLKG